MKKYAVVLAAVLFIFASLVSVFSNDITWDDIGRGNLDLRTVVVNPDNAQIIYIGSKSGVFKTEDGGMNWRNIFSIKGGRRDVNFLLFDPQDKNSLYAATANGVYHSFNQGRNWSRIFKGKNALENECTTLSILPSGIYLGTKQGLFISKDSGRSWRKETGKIGNTHVLAISYNLREPEYIYVASLDGVFKTQDAGKTWERVFVAHPVENGADKDETNEDQDEERRFSDIRYIGIDPNNLDDVYLATKRGVYKSQDKAKTWQPLTDLGLLNKDTEFLLVSLKSEIYLATKSGIFEYKNERWQELTLGLLANEIKFLAQDTQDNLYAATDKGLFKAIVRYVSDDSQNSMESLYCKGEPKINQVQEAAINYAEVQPEKIMRWRNQAAKRALLPQLSVGIDRNTSDLWHWEGGSTTKSDDDILRRGRDNIDWDITLSWNLGELIWNDDQANIDVRSRLMVQLRDDILDEVNKLYFERLRVKMELDNLTIEERKKRFEKELRLQELTASLDALTGGYFSQQINKGKGMLGG